MTKQKFMPDATYNERLQVLTDTATKVDETPQYVQLSREELDIMREKLTENLISLDEENEAYDLVKEEHKAKVKPLMAENSILITNVRTGQEKRDGKFYHIADFDSSTMVVYDAEGNWLSERRLRPEEKKGQARLFVANKVKDGTNN